MPKYVFVLENIFIRKTIFYFPRFFLTFLMTNFQKNLRNNKSIDCGLKEETIRFLQWSGFKFRFNLKKAYFFQFSLHLYIYIFIIPEENILLRSQLCYSSNSERQWVFGCEVIEPSILNIFIKIKQHFVKITYRILSTDHICNLSPNRKLVKTTFVDVTARAWHPVVKQVVSAIPLAYIMQHYWRVLASSSMLQTFTRVKGM